MFARKPSRDVAVKRPTMPAQAAPSSIAKATHWIDPASIEEGVIIVGKGAHVFGNISSCRKLEVHGVLEADVVADAVLVREGGGLKGNVQTDNAEIHGVVEGSLLVHEHLDVRGTGNVAGDLTYRTLSVETGAKVQGTIQTHPEVRTADDEGLPTAEVLPMNGSRMPTANGYHIESPPAPAQRPH